MSTRTYRFFSLLFFLLLSGVHLLFAQPQVNLGQDTVGCDSIVLDAGNPGSTYLWSNGANSQSIVVSTTGIYWVEVSNANGSSRDSIFVTVLTTPQAPLVFDTTVCANESLILEENFSADGIIWSLDSNFSQTYPNVGNFFLQDTTLYAKTFNKLFEGRVGFEDNTFAGGGFLTQLTGSRFDAQINLVIDSVAVYVNRGGTHLTIELRNDNNETLSQRQLVVATTGKTFVPLNFFVPQGSGYRIILTDISQGSIYRNGPTTFTYPQSLPGILDITATLRENGNIIPNYSTYFYDWKVSRVFCESETESLLVSSNPVPEIDLPADTSFCDRDSFLLDAEASPGATFIWNHGSTQQTLTTTTSGEYIVNAFFQADCQVSDTTNILFLQTPPSPIISDTGICFLDTFDLDQSIRNPFGASVWFEDSATTKPLGNKKIVVERDTTFYLREFSIGTRTNVGFIDNQIGSGGFGTNYTGNVFDINSPLILDSVAVYALGSDFPVEITIEDSSGSVLFERTYIVPVRNQKYFLSLNHYLLPGQDYVIQIVNGSGVPFFRSGPSSDFYPSGDANLVLTKSLQNNGNIVTNFTGNFYDWHYSLAQCSSTLDSVRITKVDRPIFSLPPDTVLCGASSFTLNAPQIPGLTYNWNTGQSVSSILVDSSDTYTVSVFLDPSCPVEDSIRIDFFDAPQSPVLQDTSTCLLSAFDLDSTIQNPGDRVIWFEDNAGQKPLLSQTITGLNDTLFYARAFNILPGGNVGFVDNQIAGGGFGTNYTGVSFDVYQPLILDSVAVYALDENFSVEIEILDENGNQVFFKEFFIDERNTKYFLPLDAFLLAGNDYLLQIANGSGVPFFRNGPSNDFYPRGDENLLLVNSIQPNGSPTTDFTGNFYDWHYQIALCETGIDSVFLDVVERPLISLPADTSFCDKDSFLLSVPQLGGITYQWNGNPGSSDLVVDSSGIYTLSAFSNPDCPTVDSIEIGFFETPDTLVIRDTVLCGFQTFNLQGQMNGDILVWYRDSMGAEVLASGAPEIQVQSDSVFYARALSTSETGNIGFADNTIASNGGFVNLRSGNVFNVFENIILETVDVYTDLPTITTDFVVQLWDQNNQVLQQKSFQIGDFGRQRLELGFNISPGMGYKLMATGITGNGIFRNGPSDFSQAYPQVIEGIVEITGVTQDGNNSVTNFSSNFYNWRLSEVKCESEIKALHIGVSLPYDLPAYTYSCEPLVFGTGLPMAVHNWSTGATADSVLIETSGIYTVEVSDGQNCLVADTFEVEIPSDAGLPDDGILCGNVLNTNYGSDAIFTWSTGDTLPTITVSDTGIYTVSVLEPRGCLLEDTVIISGFDDFPTVDLGQDYEACIETTLDLGNPGNSYSWSTGDSTQSITVSSSGFYIGTVINENDCAGSDTIAINIVPAPRADFFLNLLGFQLNCINLSTFGSYTWDFGDGNTSTSISPIHTYQDTGVFVVSLINENQCGQDTLRDTIRVVDPNVSLEKSIDAELRIYPNPGSERVVLEWGGIPLEEVRITNTVGKEVGTWRKEEISGRKMEIGVRGWPRGIYLVQFYTQDKRVVKTLMIK